MWKALDIFRLRRRADRRKQSACSTSKWFCPVLALVPNEAGQCRASNKPSLFSKTSKPRSVEMRQKSADFAAVQRPRSSLFGWC